MKEFIYSDAVPVSHINGKEAIRVVKLSKQYEKVTEPFLLKGIIIDEKTLKSGKVVRDKIHDHFYCVGVKYLFQIEPKKETNLHPVFENILGSFGMK